MTPSAELFLPRLAARRRMGRAFGQLCFAASLCGLAILIILLIRVCWQGWPWLSEKILANFPSLTPSKAGMKSAIHGTIWLITLTAIFSVPLGVGSAIYLEEYSRKTRLTRFIELNIANLAGVPSIVYGILGMAIVVRWMGFGRSVLAGGVTLSLLVMPVVIIASREALRAVPQSLRAAAYAVGATRWQTIRAHVLPAAMPGIMTGVILSLSRAIGEAAPLLLLGALNYVAFVPKSLKDDFTAIPIQIYEWCERPQPEFQHLAAAGIIVLMAILIPMNAVAIGVRAWYQRKKLF